MYVEVTVYGRIIITDDNAYGDDYNEDEMELLDWICNRIVSK